MRVKLAAIYSSVILGDINIRFSLSAEGKRELANYTYIFAK